MNTSIRWVREQYIFCLMSEEYRDGNNETSHLKISNLQNHIYILSSYNQFKLIQLLQLGWELSHHSCAISLNTTEIYAYINKTLIIYVYEYCSPLALINSYIIQYTRWDVQSFPARKAEVVTNDEVHVGTNQNYITK
jgi:hypothetical protein